MQTHKLLADKHCRAEPAFVNRELNIVAIDHFHHSEIITSRGLCFVVGKLSRIGTDAAARVDDSFLEFWVIAVKGVELLALDVLLHGFERVGHSLGYKAGGCRGLQAFQVRFLLLLATVAEHADGEHERRDSGDQTDCETRWSTDRVPVANRVDDIDGQYFLSEAAIA